MASFAPQVAAQLYTLRREIDSPSALHAALRALHTRGFRAVQFDSFVFRLPGFDAAETARVLQSLAMRCAIAHADAPALLEGPDGAAAGGASLLRALRTLECAHVAFGCAPDALQAVLREDPRAAARAWRTFAASLAAAAVAWRAVGISFSYHNHDFECAPAFPTSVGSGGSGGDDDDPDAFASPLETVLCSRAAVATPLCAEFDTYWLARGGLDPAAWLRRLAGRTVALHLKDVRSSDGFFEVVGAGTLPWRAIVDAALAAGVEWFVIEQDDCETRSPYDCLAASFRYLTEEMGLRG